MGDLTKNSLIVIIGLYGLLLTSLSHSAVLVKEKRWHNHSTLNVVFLNGKPDLHDKIKMLAPLWLEGTSLKFRFFDSLDTAPDETHIRISFTSHNGSRLGDHGEYKSSFATMNLVDLMSQDISERSIQRIILHEFGHALGFEHEYRNSNWPYGQHVIQTFTEECIPRMRQIEQDAEIAEQRCQDINQSISKKLALTTAYDERSIMNYPASFALENGFTKKIEATYTLSILDKHAIKSWYPQSP